MKSGTAECKEPALDILKKCHADIIEQYKCSQSFTDSKDEEAAFTITGNTRDIIDTLMDQEDDPTGFTPMILTTVRDVAIIQTSGFGECGEFSESLAWSLIQNGIYPTAIEAKVGDNNHGYLLVEINTGKEKINYAADPFLAVLCPQEQYLQKEIVIAYFAYAFGEDYSTKLSQTATPYKVTEFQAKLTAIQAFIDDLVCRAKPEADKKNEVALAQLKLNADHHLLFTKKPEAKDKRKKNENSIPSAQP